ncbi:maleylpyruvate isomerase N-terminal domain-containing protein [Glycomyces sp. NPDC047010]|uniref:maleylpyruvate isomerase N-terminal domain-containing protein n=1 Tax=Glycomyces sp. NPDC047010 TaxID=3155023 RepID=UPI0033DAE270
MIPPPPLPALTAETTRLAHALNHITDWHAPTRCTPWDAAALTAHITGALARLDPMLDAPEPPRATVTAAGYYAPDHRFAPDTNTTRIDTATRAAQAGGPTLTTAFENTAARILHRCTSARPGRRVTTRHGDPMTLDDFLTTRVVETAVHGIDLADATAQPRWTTPEAQHHIAHLLLGHDHPTALAALGLDPLAFIAKATGRDDFTAPERAQADALGVTWLTLG